MDKKQENQPKVEETKQEQKIKNIADMPSNNPKEESQESIMAKKIIDLEAALNQKNKEINEMAEQINKLVHANNNNAETYKAMIADMENKATKMVKEKFNELDAKFKKDLEFAKKYAIKDQALDLIDIISKFEQAVNFKPADPNIANWLRGFQMYLTMFNNLLDDLHIVRIVPQIGAEFDPNTMECFSETVKDPTKKENTICEVIHTGYKLYDQLLKPALVKVIKNN